MKRQGNNTYDVAGYVNSLYNRVGTNRNDGSVVTLADVDKEFRAKIIKFHSFEVEKDLLKHV